MAPAQKDIYIAKKISAALDEDCSELLETYNYQWVFEPILELCDNHKDANTLICAIIYSYSPNSLRCDLKMDGASIKTDILKGLTKDYNKPLFKEFIDQSNDKIREAIGNLLDTYSGDWRFVTAATNIDFHNKNIRLTENETLLAALDIDKQYKAKSELGKLRRECTLTRQNADSIIETLQRDFMITENRVKDDFNHSFVGQNTKTDIWKWRDFVMFDYLPSKNKNG